MPFRTSTLRVKHYNPPFCVPPALWPITQTLVPPHCVGAAGKLVKQEEEVAPFPPGNRFAIPPFLSRLPLLCPLFLQPYHEWREQLLGVSSHTFDPNWSWARVCNPLGQRPRFLLNGVAMMCLPSAASEGPSAWLSVSALIKQSNISSSHFCGSRLVPKSCIYDEFLTLSYYCLFDTNGYVKPQTLLENMYLVGVRIFEDLGLPPFCLAWKKLRARPRELYHIVGCKVWAKSLLIFFFHFRFNCLL